MRLYRLFDQDVAAIGDLKTSLAALQRTKARFTLDPRGEQDWSAPIESVNKAIAGLEAASRAKLLDRLLQNQQVLTAAGIAAGVAVLLSAWLLLYWLRPLLLLRIDYALRPLGEITLPGWLGGIKSTLPRCFGPRSAIVIACSMPGSPGIFRRLLRIWKSRHGLRASDPCPFAPRSGRETVGLPGTGRLECRVCAAARCLLIHGEGGAGKTSLACQIARWAIGNDGSQQLAGHAMFPF